MLNASQMSDVKAKLSAAYEGEHGSAAAIPWSQIIAVVLQLLSGCIPSPTPAKVKTACADDEQRDYAVRVGMIETMGFGAWRRHDGPAVSRSFKTVVPTLGDDVVAAAID